MFVIVISRKLKVSLQFVESNLGMFDMNKMYLHVTVFFYPAQEFISVYFP